MMQTDFNVLSLSESKRALWPTLDRKGRRRLVLWIISAVLLCIAAAFLTDSIQHQSTIGVIFSGSWIGAILVHSVIVDYLLRHIL